MDAAIAALITGLFGGAGGAALINAFTGRRTRELNEKMLGLQIKKAENDLTKAVEENVLSRIMAFSMSQEVYKHLENIVDRKYLGEKLTNYTINDNVRRELQYLADSGFINNFDVRGLQTGDDLTEKVIVTPAGRDFVELRKKTSCKLHRPA